MSIDLFLSSIKEVSTTEQKMITAGYLQVIWTDELLLWNSKLTGMFWMKFRQVSVEEITKNSIISRVHSQVIFHDALKHPQQRILMNDLKKMVLTVSLIFSTFVLTSEQRRIKAHRQVFQCLVFSTCISCFGLFVHYYRCSRALSTHHC